MYAIHVRPSFSRPLKETHQLKSARTGRRLTHCHYTTTKSSGADESTITNSRSTIFARTEHARLLAEGFFQSDAKWRGALLSERRISTRHSSCSAVRRSRFAPLW